MNRFSACALVVAMTLGACGRNEDVVAESTRVASVPPEGAAAARASAVPMPPPSAAAVAAPTPAAGDQRSGTSPRELSNPDDATVVLLYHDLAGIAPPIDDWVENDFRLQSAAAPDKATRRAQLRQELHAAVTAVRDVGLLRLSLDDAQLSDYDPTYGEFTIRALAPSSVVSFEAWQRKVSVKFDNARVAQIWKVAPDQAQAVRDKLGPNGRVSIDLALRITGVVPGTEEGTISTRVEAYELRTQRSGVTIARNQL